MEKVRSIEFARLLGFEAIGDEVSGSVDFRDEALDAKLGAKVGEETLVALDVASALAGATAAKAD